MSATEIEVGATAVRPKTLSRAWLIQRAALGMLILVAGTIGSVWLYDASLKANALGPSTTELVTRTK